MDWRQWQNVAQSNDLSNVWNRQTTPPWMRPGNQRPPMRGQPQPGQVNYNNPSGQPRPGVHPDDWNNRQPGTGSGYAGNNMNWPQNPDNQDNRDRDRDRSRNDRRRNRKNRRKDQNNDRGQQNNEVLNAEFSFQSFVNFTNFSFICIRLLTPTYFLILDYKQTWNTVY